MQFLSAILVLASNSGGAAVNEVENLEQLLWVYMGFSSIKFNFVKPLYFGSVMVMDVVASVYALLYFELLVDLLRLFCTWFVKYITGVDMSVLVLLLSKL